MTFGNPGMEVTATFSPLDRCDMIDVGSIITDDDYVQPVYNPTVNPDTFRLLCTLGEVGLTVSAIIDVLENCGYVDVGKIIEDELGDGSDLPLGSMYVTHNDIRVVFGDKTVIFTRSV